MSNEQRKRLSCCHFEPCGEEMSEAVRNLLFMQTEYSGRFLVAPRGRFPRNDRMNKNFKTMKKTILLFLFLPLLALSQTKPSGWLTPYANAEFNNGKIIYTIISPQQHLDARLLPLMLPRNLVQLRMDNRPVTVSGKYIAESQQKIRDYLNTEPVNLRSAKQKNEYLRLSAMVVLWDLKLSSFCQNNLKQMAQSEDKQLKRNAETVLKVLAVFEENRK